MLIGPVVAEVDAFTVSVLVTAAVEVMLTGPTEQVRPVVPVHEKVTLPVNPCTGVTVMVSVVLLPLLTVSVLLPEEREKSGTLTATLMTTEFVVLPLVPVRVTVPL